MPTDATLTDVNIFPIKSCRGVSLQTSTITGIGLAEDRRWQIIGTDERRGVTQRTYRSLALVQPELIDGGGLRISAPGMPAIDVARPSGPVIEVHSHFRVPVPGRDAGDEASEWFTEYLGVPLRLVRMEGDGGWRLPAELDIFGQGAGFTDAAPVLVASQDSLDWLVERATEGFGMSRFRPNLVVAGAEPWAEDTWDRFQIGDAELRAVVPWPRCAIPQVDQETAERHKEPAKVLKKHRWCTSAPTVPGDFRRIVEGNGLFGIACTIGPMGATVSIGDQVKVANRREAVLQMV